MSPPSTPEIPNAARIYDYTLGGTHHTPVDRAAAEYMISLVPSTRKWVRMLRDFLPRVARQLHAEGLHHFVDFASGLPTADHIHAALPPSARIVYSDVDPYTIGKARTMVGHLPNVRYVQHDVREAGALLDDPEVDAFLGGERRLAFGLSGVTVFFTNDEIARVLHDLHDRAAPGSRVYITWETKDPARTTPQLDRFLDMFRQAGAPYHFHTVDECVQLSAPWRLPALVPLREFLGLPGWHITEKDREGVGLEFYAAILEKP